MVANKSDSIENIKIFGYWEIVSQIPLTETLVVWIEIQDWDGISWHTGSCST